MLTTGKSRCAKTGPALIPETEPKLSHIPIFNPVLPHPYTSRGQLRKEGLRAGRRTAGRVRPFLDMERSHGRPRLHPAQRARGLEGLSHRPRPRHCRRARRAQPPPDRHDPRRLLPVRRDDHHQPRRHLPRKGGPSPRSPPSRDLQTIRTQLHPLHLPRRRGTPAASSATSTSAARSPPATASPPTSSTTARARSAGPSGSPASSPASPAAPAAPPSP